mmetsp:Transcript_25144/g.72350  ORF Transcript_25144/g.72350 Transcript_25144/m.72350 type:complete len:211 (-) Transcript_25144:77-709(-)
MHTASEERSSEQLQLRRRSAAVTLERCFRGLHDRSIYHAALEHRPLFQLAMSIRDSDGNPVFFQREEGRPFSEQHTVKVLLGEEYEVALELDDLGRTVTAVESVDIDAQQLSVSRSSVHHRERTNSYVYALHGHWSPRHVQATSVGERDVCLVEVRYFHGQEACLLELHLQLKIYQQKKRLQSRGLPLKAATCRFDASVGIERWSFAPAR